MLRIRTGVLLTLLCAVPGPVRAAVDAPLADAVMRQDHDAVRALLAAGAAVDAPRGDGMTALHWAARHGDVETGPPAPRGRHRPRSVRPVSAAHTPLHVAGRAGHAPVIAALLAHRANAEALTSAGAAPTALRRAIGERRRRSRRCWRTAPTPTCASPGGARPPSCSQRGRRGPRPSRPCCGGGRTPHRRGGRGHLRPQRVRPGRQPAAARPRGRRSRRTGDGTRPPGAASGPGARVCRVRRRRPPFRRPASPRPAPAAEADRQEEPEPLGFADLVGTHGGLTALLLAARDGHTDTALALIAGGADVNQVRRGRRHEPPAHRGHQRALRSGPAAPRVGSRPHPGERGRRDAAVRGAQHAMGPEGPASAAHGPPAADRPPIST